jgi:hypothetical protein
MSRWLPLADTLLAMIVEQVRQKSPEPAKRALQKSPETARRALKPPRLFCARAARAQTHPKHPTLHTLHPTPYTLHPDTPKASAAIRRSPTKEPNKRAQQKSLTKEPY